MEKEIANPENIKNKDFDLILKGKVKFDPRTPFENLFRTGIWLCPFLGLMSVFAYVATKISLFIPLVFLGFFGMIPCLILYFLTDNYYILDCDRQQLMYRFKFLFYEKIYTYALFKDIHAVTIKSTVKRSSSSKTVGAPGAKSRKFWKYQILIALSSGKVLPITNLEQAIFIKEEKQAKKIAQTTKAKYVQGFDTRPSNPHIIKGNDGKYSFQHGP